ncbi:MAG: ATP-binding protein, partial [Thaumarchaeota archaeon]|nr:ATP-binding protein [Nitrososphaerota archaeon]
MEFKDRKHEMKELREVMGSQNFELLILYGRRRVGKTELILNLTKDSKRIYYLATGEKNLEHFYRVCSEYDKGMAQLKMDYEVLFDHLKDKVDVVIIDEFQEMIREDANTLNLLQRIVDTKLNKSRLKLILLGSSVSIMGSRVLSYKSPLYGRRTGSMKLKPVGFFDLREFFPSAGIQELLEIYSFADGIPFYLIKIALPFRNWLAGETANRRSFLKDEVDFIMKYEFDNPATYKIILEAIARGKTKLNEIRDYARMPRTDLSPYLRNLVEVDMVRREVPITENMKSRFGRYYLNDNFLRFWFR